MWKLLAKGLKSVAAGKAQANLGLQSPHLPNAITRVGRFLYVTSIGWISTVWYTGYVNMRTEPGSGPKLVLPGKKVIGSPDRPDKSPSFAHSIAVTSGPGQGASGEFISTPNQSGRTLVALQPNQLGVPGTAVSGYLWSAPSNMKQLPQFNRGRYTALTAVASSIARQYGLHITSGYRPGTGNLHSSGLAFDMVGAQSNMQRAARWAASNPAMFQEIFLHNEGSGLHLHLGFYPDAAGTFNSAANSQKRASAGRH